MAERPEAGTGPQSDSETQEPGILENYGTFPVLLLKLIQMITPDFLISKTPPKKKDYRI